MTRKPGFDLAAELAKPGFTPGARDAAALVELVAGANETAATRAAPALASLREPGRRAIVERITSAQLRDYATHDDAAGDDAGRARQDRVTYRALDEGAHARLVGVLGLLAREGDAEAQALLLSSMQHALVRVRRAAASALGKLGGDDARGALLARWDAGDATPDERRVLVEALGKVGGDDVLARLRALDASDDTELARKRDRALLMADRSAQRGAESAIVIDVAPPMPLRVRLGCRAGLAGLLVEELASLGVSAKAMLDSEAELELAKPLETLFASHLWANISIRMPLPAGDDLAETLVRTITAAPMRALLRTWTRGSMRWRLGFTSGHKRAVVWRVARDVTAAAPELVNDPQATTWDILVDDEARSVSLVPRKLADPRFAWRVAEVPAASHPSVAAALVWVAEVRDADRIWDPFCGSAVELVERARRGPVTRIIGSDIDDDALAAARKNADAAGVTLELARADARSFTPGEIDLAITNPPLGSRVHGDAAALLVESVPNIARQLVRCGRLVWITPAFRKTTPACERAGLSRASSLPVDLGGVRGHLERWEKRT